MRWDDERPGIGGDADVLQQCPFNPAEMVHCPNYQPVALPVGRHSRVTCRHFAVRASHGALSAGCRRQLTGRP